jgi:hypothetical protein
MAGPARAAAGIDCGVVERGRAGDRRGEGVLGAIGEAVARSGRPPGGVAS